MEELDWSQWDGYEVRVVVSNPVLREIDDWKNKGNDRRAKRARAANAMFGNMLSTGSKVVRESSPRVTLHVEPGHQYSLKLSDQLDYSERDDQLVGIVHRFAKEKPGEDVRLLTRDTIPLYRAKGLQLKAERIEEAWLLPPENDESQKQIAALKDEIAG